jgi:hypothetical protein
VAVRADLSNGVDSLASRNCSRVMTSPRYDQLQVASETGRNARLGLPSSCCLICRVVDEVFLQFFHRNVALLNKSPMLSISKPFAIIGKEGPGRCNIINAAFEGNLLT